MFKIQHRRSVRHHITHLPLFDWATLRDIPPLTNGGRWVSCRTGVPPRIANAIADLAGIGPEHEK